MKHPFKILMTVYFFVLALAVGAHADDKAGDMQLPPDTSSSEFQRIKSLEGRWVTESSMFGKKEKLYTEYEVTANGSAVLERIFPGTPHEMMSVYYDDDKGKLAMTHYCIMRNRPTLKLASSTDDSMTLRVASVSGAKSTKENSMGDVTLTFKDKDHLSSTCRGRGKEAEDMPPMTMEFTRIK